MKYIRKILGVVIIFLDSISRPKPIHRSAADQHQVDEQTSHLSLYQFHTCPFCVKVRRAIHKLNLKINLRDAKQPDIEKELVSGGGKRKVPCLRIQKEGRDEWMYESNDINAYLEESFAGSA